MSRTRAWLREIDCECWPGITTTASRHCANHLVWERGKEIGAAALRAGIAAEGFSVVTGDSPPAANDFAYALAQTFRRQGRYDFVSWVDGSGEDREVYHARMVILAQEGVAQAWAVVRDRDWAYWTGDAKPDGNISGQRHPCVSVETLFVSKAARHISLARRLVAEIARQADVSISELAWGAPLSADGEAFVQAVVGPHFWIT